jgi:hypothetical protein
MEMNRGGDDGQVRLMFGIELIQRFKDGDGEGVELIKIRTSLRERVDSSFYPEGSPGPVLEERG